MLDRTFPRVEKSNGASCRAESLKDVLVALGDAVYRTQRFERALPLFSSICDVAAHYVRLQGEVRVCATMWLLMRLFRATVYVQVCVRHVCVQRVFALVCNVCVCALCVRGCVHVSRGRVRVIVCVCLRVYVYCVCVCMRPCVRAHVCLRLQSTSDR